MQQSRNVTPALQTPQRYVVVHKPAKTKRIEYTGPFVSKEAAEEFEARFPVGSSVVRPLRARQDYEE